jgi:hypothetical protein
MVNDSNQVQVAADDQALRDEVLAWVRELETNPCARLKSLELPRQPKQYPGEDEGGVVAALLQRFSRSRKKQEPLLEVLHSLQRLERACGKRNGRAIRRLVPDVLAKKIEKGLRRVQLLIWVNGSHLQLMPASLYGFFVQNVLTLFEMNRVSRIRQCGHCGTWFYARLVHQKFCNDPVKKCQWNDFHTSEYRSERYRQRNRRYQREYRKRNPGRRN